MAQARTQGPGLPAKGQPDIYTLLLLVAILALVATIGFVLYNLLSASQYGLSIANLFGALPSSP
jgi:hypothetical protein